jgi:hypothetical protein
MSFQTAGENPAEGLLGVSIALTFPTILTNAVSHG